MAVRTDADVAVDARLIGSSAGFRDVIARIARFSACDAPVLIEGETGTGKELVARALHYRSARRGQPFVPVNCAALPEQLVVSELFGHERGAFTGAQGRRSGLVEQARRGTIFFDEVDSLPLAAQAVLLRFLQDQEYRPLGAGSLMHADTRVLAASNVCMLREVRERRFREDLYHRLNVLTLCLPPLRARGRDVLELAGHFLGQLGRLYRRAPKALSAAAVRAMMAHDWPGNVRELENRLHRAFLMADGREITAADLGLVGADAEQGAEPPAPPDQDTFAAAKARAVADFERAYLCNLMARTRGNVSAASRLAGKERRTFARLLKKHGIERQQYLSRATQPGREDASSRD
ncbi:MAG TPA: sigma-54 dependent transcriptional regulator [Geminicoccaceae bacterium]|nr:sigma-54 dependent transcriptional regulator [Geminicoccaceae bacterium]